MIPQRFTFQWHITNECNLRCKHCYQDDYKDGGPEYQKLVEYYKQIEDFVLFYKANNSDFKAHINFTGGEPFLKKEFLDILKLVQKRQVFSFGILSNGYLLKHPELNQLKSINPRFIQLSLEGSQFLNDQIRGSDAFNQTIKAIKAYNRLNIPVLISFTANSLNYKEIIDVIRICRKYNISKVWMDRYIPLDKDDKLIMSTYQFKEFLMLLQKEQDRKWVHFFNKTEISASRALQFLSYGGKPYSCSAGITLLALMPNGDILPCRRLPIVVGNLNNKTIAEVYNENTVLIRLRDDKNIDDKCKKCYYSQNCRGGLKCMSYVINGNFHSKDPNCWI